MMRLCSVFLLALAGFLQPGAAQPLGADPSIQAPGAVLELGVLVTVNLFGNMPPWSIYLLNYCGTTVQTITDGEGFWQFSWTPTAFDGISCCGVAYRLKIVDLFGDSGLSDFFMFSGCPTGCSGFGTNTTTTITVSELGTNATVTVTESAAASTDTITSTITSDIGAETCSAATVTKYPKCCPVSLVTSTVTHHITVTDS